MFRSRQRLLALGFGAALLSACSSVQPAPTSETASSLDTSACLKATVQGPDSVIEGQGLSANLTVENTCDEAMQITVADATNIRGGKDTGIEISFHIDITDPQEASHSGYLVRWSWIQPNRSYVNTQKMITLDAGEEIVRDLSWDGRLDNGKVLPSGDYVLFGSYYYTPKGPNHKDFNVISGQQPFKIVSD